MDAPLARGGRAAIVATGGPAGTDFAIDTPSPVAATDAVGSPIRRSPPDDAEDPEDAPPMIANLVPHPGHDCGQPEINVAHVGQRPGGAR